MHTKKQGKPFFAELKPSKKLLRLAIIIHLLALTASFANALPLILKLVTATFVAVNFMTIYKTLKSETRKIKWSDKGQWEIARGNEFDTADILASSVLTTFCIVLHIRNQPPFLIASDALDESRYRQLAVKLKMTQH